MTLKKISSQYSDYEQNYFKKSLSPINILQKILRNIFTYRWNHKVAFFATAVDQLHNHKSELKDQNFDPNSN